MTIANILLDPWIHISSFQIPIPYHGNFFTLSNYQNQDHQVDNQLQHKKGPNQIFPRSAGADKIEKKQGERDPSKCTC